MLTTAQTASVATPGTMPNVYRGAYLFRNSPAAILRFPFPFATDSYRTTVNVEPHDRTGDTAAFHVLFDVDEHYRDEIEERAYVLQIDPSRCRTMPHMAAAEWEALDFIMENLVRDFPQHFALTRSDGVHVWENRLLGITQRFVFGDASTLPYAPYEYITRQVQGDFVLMDHRSNDLWLDSGMVTASYGWSFDFVHGMHWRDWHGPALDETERLAVDRSLRMTMAMKPERHLRRVNWMVQVRPRLDRSLEAMPDWQFDGRGLTFETIGEMMHLHTEFQQLYRLPRTGAIIFVLRHYLLSFNDLARVPKWCRRLHRVLRDLDPASGRYSSFPQRDVTLSWLARFDDGAPTSPGRGHDLSSLEII